MNKAKIVSATISASLLLLSASAVSFAGTVDVVGNGADSDNTANISVQHTTTITQQNTADVNNRVNVDANTGYNTANKNTGGDVGISTGDSSVKVAGSTTANGNTASACCGSSLDLVAKISGNGADSDNTVNLNLSNENNIYSVNEFNVKNKFDVDANSGGNRANKNTGGDVQISTGNVMVDLLLNNKANSNVATVACNCSVANNPGSTPTAPGVTPGVPAVMGASTLPNTGFDYPTKLILLVTAGLIGSGLALRKNSDSLEKLLTGRFGI